MDVHWLSQCAVNVHRISCGHKTFIISIRYIHGTSIEHTCVYGEVISDHIEICNVVEKMNLETETGRIDTKKHIRKLPRSYLVF